MKPRNLPPAGPVILRVSGKPATAGSHIPFVDKQGRPRVLHDNKRYKAWGKLLRATLYRCYVLHKFGPHVGPVAMGLVYRIARPKNHWGTGKHARRLKATAPQWPTAQKSTLDVSKVIRAAEDSLTGLAWVDDAQIVIHRTAKFYCATPEGTDEGIEIWIGGVWLDLLDAWVSNGILSHSKQFSAISADSTNLEKIT